MLGKQSTLESCWSWQLEFVEGSVVTVCTLTNSVSWEVRFKAFRSSKACLFFKINMLFQLDKWQLRIAGVLPFGSFQSRAVKYIRTCVIRKILTYCEDFSFMWLFRVFSKSLNYYDDLKFTLILCFMNYEFTVNRNGQGLSLWHRLCGPLNQSKAQ